MLVVTTAFIFGGILALALRGDFGRFAGGKVETVTGKALVGGPFSLIDHTGRRVSEKDFAGRYMLVYFGFTYCPDICPTELQIIGAALSQLGVKAQEVVPVFITVDPERDTIEQMASYISNFHPSLVGLTGTAQEIAAVARAYRVYYAKSKDENSSSDYTMDHTSIIYLMDKEGAYLTHFAHGTLPEKLAQKLSDVLSKG